MNRHNALLICVLCREFNFLLGTNNTLSGIVRSTMGLDPLSGDVFIFINKTHNSIKLLHWERGGMVIYHKRLEKGRFAIPSYNEQTRNYHILWHDLVILIEDIDAITTKQRKRFVRTK